MSNDWNEDEADGQQTRLTKPEGSSWTDEQWEAIRLRGSDILVAAAAGSGKTAVLVERIIRRITDGRDPVDVDRLLVATFTNAAAGEMRQRIREAIEKRLEASPESEHLRRQIALIHRAPITTLHSFCLDVIRRHHERIRLDPAFRIANETEAELMRQDILSDLLEEQYAQNGDNSVFWQLADAFGGERGDDALFRLIQRLYDYSRSHPWPDEWLLEMAAQFGPPHDGASVQGLAESFARETDAWRDALIADVRLELQGAASLLEEALRLCGRPGGPQPYADNLRDDLAQLAEASRAADRSWADLYAAMRELAFGKLNACRGSGIDKALQERVKQLRDRAKKQLADIREELFERTPEQYAEELAAIAPLVRKLAELVIEFGERYRKKKAGKGLVDFSDLEHYALAILRRDDCPPGLAVPSDAAEQYRDRFAEILLDEYQDTNTVQETIVSLISRPAPGNRFMVGDVKQSIYRFRLAEPGLFMAKYRSFEPAACDRPIGGRKIDLARNFRSRLPIVDGVNFIFKQIMSERVGEMDYDEAAQLVCGASYPESPDDLAVELALLDRGGTGGEDEAAFGGDSDDQEEADETARNEAGVNLELEEQQTETAQLEARYIIARIRRFIGADGHPPLQVYDRAKGGVRPAAYRDIVILLRATSQWASVLMDELRAAGIPGYADLNTGYFTATEVETMMSLLALIDNPYQDIPAAAVLRSPMYGLTAEELARIRIRGKSKPFYEAVLTYAASADDGPAEASARRGNVREGGGTGKAEGDVGAAAPDRDRIKKLEGMNAANDPAEKASDGASEGVSDESGESLRAKLSRFLKQLENWRNEARQGSLSQLIWSIYGETGYYDFVGGLPGGMQRQANLRALYDRARQYEATSLRGLFRFLRFVERMKDSGADLGAARALGEQEDVVRIMSIHKSKGLEFPVVFVAGLGKSFNQTDLHDPFLLHKELGFGPMFVDSALRVACPTLPMLAIRRRMKMEMLAEEFRVLYVALTRPKEKMVLVGTVKSIEKEAQKWSRMLEETDWQLPAHEMARARSYLDWLGPALIRHPDASALRNRCEEGAAYRVPTIMTAEPSNFRIGILSSLGYAQAAATVEVRFADERMEAVAQLKPVPGTSGDAEAAATLNRRFEWTYPYRQASELFSKTSISELKRMRELSFGREDEEAAEWPGLGLEPGRQTDVAEADRGHGSRVSLKPLARRPAFMGKRATSAAERGTIYHAVMQHLPLAGEMSEGIVRQTLERMVSRELLAPEHREAVDPETIVAFFRQPIGRRLLAADQVHREVPFSCGLPAEEAYPGAQSSVRGDTVLVQGMIDCLFEENGQLVLLDYKTDALYGGRLDALTKRYGVQLGLYAIAIERIWHRPVKEKVLYFFDGSHIVPLDGG